jgi:hypothetical protein
MISYALVPISPEVSEGMQHATNFETKNYTSHKKWTKNIGNALVKDNSRS